MSYVSENMLPEDTAAFPHTVNITAKKVHFSSCSPSVMAKKECTEVYIYVYLE